MSNMRSAWRTRGRGARVGRQISVPPWPPWPPWALGTSSKTRFLQFSSVNSPPCSIAGHWDLLLDLQQILRYGSRKFTKHEPQESSGFMSKTFGHLWTPLDPFFVALILLDAQFLHHASLQVVVQPTRSSCKVEMEGIHD